MNVRRSMCSKEIGISHKNRIQQTCIDMWWEWCDSFESDKSCQIMPNHLSQFQHKFAQIYCVHIILLCLNSWLYKNKYSYSSRDLVVIFVIIGHATPSINFVYATTASKVHVICTPNVEHYITVSIKPIVNKRSWGSDMTKIKTSLVIFLWAKWRYCDVCTAVWPPSCIQLFSKVTERFAFFSFKSVEIRPEIELLFSVITMNFHWRTIMKNPHVTQSVMSTYLLIWGIPSSVYVLFDCCRFHFFMDSPHLEWLWHLYLKKVMEHTVWFVC